MTTPPPVASRRSITRVGADVADLIHYYARLAEEAREYLADAKRARPPIAAHVAHWEEVATRANVLHAAALALAAAHHDLDAVTIIGGLSSAVERDPSAYAADIANTALDAQGSEAALLLAHADVMREKDPEPYDEAEEEPTPVPDDYGYADVATLEETPSVLRKVGKAMRSW